MSTLVLENIWAWAVQVAAVAAAGLVLPVLARLTSPAARLTYLRAVLLACLVLPLVQPWIPLESPGAPPGAVTIQAGGLVPDETAATDWPEPIPAATAPAEPLWPWPLEQTLIGIAVAGSFARFAWLGLGFVSLGRLRQRSTPLDPLPESVDDARLAVAASADILVSDTVARPVTFGFRRPVVIVPRSFLDLAPDEQRTIAMHELLHVRRRDWLRTLADEAVRGVLWFHPAIWWLIDQIHLGIEQVVDREVVRLSGSRRPYLDALLKIAATRSVPVLHPASMFLKQRHLAQRVASLVKEASMSRIRLAASVSVVGVLLAASGYLVVQAFPLRTMLEPVVLPELQARAEAAPREVPPPPPLAPRAERPPALSAVPDGATSEQGSAPQQTKPVVDPKLQAPRPGMVTSPPPPPPPPKVDEPTLKAMIQAKPDDPSAYYALAKLYEDQKRFDEAEQTLVQAKAVAGNPARTLLHIAGYYNRRGDFDRTIAALKERFELEPANPEAPYTIATYYWDKAYRDQTLSDNDKNALVAQGLIAIDDALRLKPEYLEALTYKNLLIRLLATLTQDPERQQTLIAQADKYRDQALEIRRKSSVPAPPNAVRVGGGIAPPRKIKDVKPEYPAVAAAARVQGVVILEILVNEDGTVGAAKVLRSIPLLDEAAIAAVKQWEFTPVTLDGQTVPAILTVTVNFTFAGLDAGEVPPPPPQPPPGSPSAQAAAAAASLRSAKDAADPWYPPNISRVGGSIQPPRKVTDVRPVYPQEARDANVQGVVILEAVIGTDGRVTKARVLRSIPMLDQAALDAVQQWEFTPTALNGILVPVVMTVTVNFTQK